MSPSIRAGYIPRLGGPNPDTCDGAGGGLDNFEGVGFPDVDPSQDQCDNPDICDGSGSCGDNFVSDWYTL